MTGKLCYTKAEAKRAALNARRTTFSHYSTYRCDDSAKHPGGAGLFHIGHTPRGSRRRFKLKPF